MEERLNKIPEEFEEDEEKISDDEKLKRFPKRIGIVFIEKMKGKSY